LIFFNFIVFNATFSHTILSPIRRGFVPGFCKLQKRCTRLAAASDNVYLLFAYGRWVLTKHSGFFHH
jgi:hypothetical protein